MYQVVSRIKRCSHYQHFVCTRSPDTSWSLHQNKVVTPTTTTPGPGSRRESVWSTISMIKSKLGGGRSNASFENIREERFWELLGNKNVELESNASSPQQMEVRF